MHTRACARTSLPLDYHNCCRARLPVMSPYSKTKGMYDDDVSQIESTLDGLDPCTIWRVYLSYSPDDTPVEVFTQSGFQMLPSHLKEVAWLLAAPHPLKIVFCDEKHTIECLLKNNTTTAVSRNRRTFISKRWRRTEERRGAPATNVG